MPNPNPRRKFDLLKILSAALGPDLHRRELSVAELEAVASEHGIDTSTAYEATLPCPRCRKQIGAHLTQCPQCGLRCNCENCQVPIDMTRVTGPEEGRAAGIGFCPACEAHFNRSV